ncbi:MAG: hypothetical protein AAB963_01230, partial [Patescibacteria group bacterium]
MFTSINTRAALGEWKAFYIEPIILFIIIITTVRQHTGHRSLITDYKLLNSIILALTLCGLATSLL